jgi:hypothetical protein
MYFKYEFIYFKMEPEKETFDVTMRLYFEQMYLEFTRRYSFDMNHDTPRLRGHYYKGSEIFFPLLLTFRIKQP